jgi:hypothetical protein
MTQFDGLSKIAIGTARHPRSHDQAVLNASRCRFDRGIFQRPNRTPVPHDLRLNHDTAPSSREFHLTSRLRFHAISFAQRSIACASAFCASCARSAKAPFVLLFSASSAFRKSRPPWPASTISLIPRCDPVQTPRWVCSVVRSVSILSCAPVIGRPLTRLVADGSASRS